METAASSDPEELQTTSARKNGLLLIEAGHWRFIAPRVPFRRISRSLFKGG
jgi:hypothetical protein